MIASRRRRFGSYLYINFQHLLSVVPNVIECVQYLYYQIISEMGFKEPKFTNERGETTTTFCSIAHLLGWQGQLREVTTLTATSLALSQEKN